MKLNEDKLNDIVIDFTKIRQGRIDESFLAMFGFWVKEILDRMFSGSSIPVAVRGRPEEVQAFARAIAGEKSYIETAKQYGLDNPRTYKDKAKLSSSIGSFERITGIKWPFK